MRRRTLAVLLGTTLALVGAGPADAAAASRAAAARPAQAAPAAASKTGVFQIPAVSRSVLKNGLTVLVLERRSVPLVQIRLLIKSGAVSDPAGKEGTASLTARLLQRGTKTRPARQFAEEVEYVGGTINTVAGRESTIVVGEFASRDLEVAFNLIADLVLAPVFAAEEFEKEKRLVLADLIALQDDPEAVADLAYQSWVYGSHPYGRPREGTERSVQAITRADVTAFHAGRYVPNQAILAVVGDVSASQAAQKATQYFAAWKRRAVAETRLPEVVRVSGRKVLLVDKPDATQSQIRMGNIALRRGDPEYVPLIVGNTVLGGGFTSWLVEEVRVKRGLTYSIRSRLQALRTAGDFRVATFSRNATVAETIKVSLEQMRRLRDQPLPPQELDKGRSFEAGLYPLRIEDPGNLAAEILEVEFHGLDADYINQYQKRVRATGPEAVKRAARYVPLDDLALVVVGPAAALKKDLEAFGPVTVRPLETVIGR